MTRKQSLRVYSLALTGEQLDENIRLLKLLRSELKSAIDTAIVPGELEPGEEIDREHVARNRRDRLEAAKLLKLLREARDA